MSSVNLHKKINNITIEEIFNILKEAARFELDDDNNGFGSINKTFHSK